MISISPRCPVRTQKSGCVRTQNVATYTQSGYTRTQHTEMAARQSGKIKETVPLQPWEWQAASVHLGLRDSSFYKSD